MILILNNKEIFQAGNFLEQQLTMARRKRTIKKNKQEEVQDEEVLVDVMQVTEEAGDFMERNQNALFGGLVALVLLVGGWLAYKNFYVQPKQEAAIEQIWVAENQFAKDSFALAINNPGGSNLGFADIEKDFGVADASNAAAYYSAVGFMNLSLIHIPSPRDGLLSRMPSSA